MDYIDSEYIYKKLFKIKASGARQLKSTQDIRELIIKENQELIKENEEQSQKILLLESRLSEFSNQHGQQIDDIGESVARFSNDIDEIEESVARFYEDIKDIDNKIDSIPHKRHGNIIPFCLIGGAALAVIIALGLSLDFKIGNSKITYNGDGIITVLVQGLGFAVGGGVASQTITPIKKLLNNNLSNGN